MHGDAQGVLETDQMPLPVAVAKLEQAQANYGTHLSLGVEFGGAYGAGLAVGEVKAVAVSCDTAGLGQRCLRQGAVGNGLGARAGVGSYHSGWQVHHP